MLELLNSLTWEAVFTIFGSLVAFIVGVLAIINTFQKNQQSKPAPQPTPQPEFDRESALAQLRKEELDQIHSRISSAKEVALENKGEMRVLRNLLEALEKRTEDHERRDIEDFKAMNAKLDKVMDIVVQILQDDKL